MRLKPESAITLLVVLVIAAEFFLLGDVLEYRRALLPSQPWRLPTGHFAHMSLLHAVVNSVALLLLVQLFTGRLRPSEQWAVLLGAPIILSLVFWTAMPGLHWYRGLSGTLHALYFAGCVVWFRESIGRDRWLPIAALAGGTLKVLLEQPWNDTFPWAAWLGAPVVPQAHLIGMLVGAAAGLWFAARRRKRQPPAG